MIQFLNSLPELIKFENQGSTVYRCVCIYIIYTHRYIHTYIYGEREEERDLYISIYLYIARINLGTY